MVLDARNYERENIARRVQKILPLVLLRTPPSLLPLLQLLLFYTLTTAAITITTATIDTTITIATATATIVTTTTVTTLLL